MVKNKKVNTVKLLLYLVFGLYLTVIITNLSSYHTTSRINEDEFNNAGKETLDLKLKDGTITQKLISKDNNISSDSCLNLYIGTHNQNDINIEIEVAISNMKIYSFKGKINDNSTVILKPHNTDYNKTKNYIRITSDEINLVSIWCFKNNKSNYLINQEEREYNICLVRDLKYNKKFKLFSKISYLWDLEKNELLYIFFIIISLKIYSFVKLLNRNYKYIIFFISSFILINSIIIPPLLNSDEYQHYLGFYNLDEENNIDEFKQFISKVHWSRLASSSDQKFTSLDITNVARNDFVNTNIGTRMLDRSIIAGNLFNLLSGIISNISIPYQILILRISSALVVLTSLFFTINLKNKLFILLCFSIPYLSIMTSSISNYSAGIALFFLIILSINKNLNSLKIFLITIFISLLFYEAQSMIMIIPSLITIILVNLFQNKNQGLSTIRFSIYLLTASSIIYILYPNNFQNKFNQINFNIYSFLLINILLIIFIKSITNFNRKFLTISKIKFSYILYFVLSSIIFSFLLNYPSVKDVQILENNRFFEYFLSIFSNFSSWFRIYYPDYSTQRTLFLGHPIEQISLNFIADANNVITSLCSSWSLLIMYFVFLGTLICKNNSNSNKYLPSYLFVLISSVLFLYIIEFFHKENMNGRYLFIYLLHLLYILYFYSLKVTYPLISRNFFAYLIKNKYYILLIIFILNNSISVSLIFKRFY
jgi:hypothetical protein